jgi:hypothetical protein
MTNPAKFFEDNLQRLGSNAPREKPLEYNLNSGLLALCKEITQMQSDISALSRQLTEIKRKIGS